MSLTKSTIIRFFTSMQLTVVLLAASIVLVFVATLAQVNLGVWGVQEKYFRTFLVWYDFPGSKLSIPVFPGGYIIGGLLLLNLLAAHVYRFRFSLKRCGIILTHAGLILLLVGELVSGLLQEDFQMQLQLNTPTNYSESFHHNELVFVDTSAEDSDQVTAIPESLLKQGSSLQHHSLPFSFRVLHYYPNAILEMKQQGDSSAPVATQGFAPQVKLTPLPITYKSDERNMPAAILEITGPEGSLGTWLVSNWLTSPQHLDVDGRHFDVMLRVERRYKPFSLTLTDLRHDVYPGSEIPRNFSSRVRLQSQDGKADREVLIYMNNPLRYGGYTFYQYQMNKASSYSVLQVVRNPGWQIPYISCLMMTFGLFLHFSIMLAIFVVKHYSTEQSAAKA